MGYLKFDISSYYSNTWPQAWDIQNASGIWVEMIPYLPFNRDSCAHPIGVSDCYSILGKNKNFDCWTSRQKSPS